MKTMAKTRRDLGFSRGFLCFSPPESVDESPLEAYIRASHNISVV